MNAQIQVQWIPTEQIKGDLHLDTLDTLDTETRTPKHFHEGSLLCSPLHPLVLGTQYVLDEWITEGYSQWEGHVFEIMVVAYFWIAMSLLRLYTHGCLKWSRI